jgi:hypothetical protein
LALNLRACNLLSSPDMDVTVGKLDVKTSVISAYLDNTGLNILFLETGNVIKID